MRSWSHRFRRCAPGLRRSCLPGTGRASTVLPVANGLDRRTFLRRGLSTAAGAVLLGGVGPTLLAACGSDDDDSNDASSGGGGDLQKVAFQFSWIKNVEFAGTYVGDDR